MTCCTMHQILGHFPVRPTEGDGMEHEDRWIIMPEHEVYGYPEPEVGQYEFYPWAVVDAGEDDPPICTTDMPEKAQKIAEALNLAERVAGRIRRQLDQILERGSEAHG